MGTVRIKKIDPLKFFFKTYRIFKWLFKTSSRTLLFPLVHKMVASDHPKHVKLDFYQQSYIALIRLFRAIVELSFGVMVNRGDIKRFSGKKNGFLFLF